MMVEEYEFWSTKKKKFVVKLAATALVICLVIAGAYAWLLYHQKTHEPQGNANPPIDPAAAVLSSKPDSTNTEASSLSPLPAESNSN